MSPRSQIRTAARASSQTSSKGPTPRFVPRSSPESTSVHTASLVADMSNSNFSLLSYPTGNSQQDTSASWSSNPAHYYPGNDDSQFEPLSMDTLSLTTAPYMEPVMSTSTCYDDATYDLLAEAVVPRHQSLTGSFSQPTYQADLLTQDLLHGSPLNMDFQYNQFPQDNWPHGYPTPPSDIFQADLQDCSPASLSRNIAMQPLPAPATECEFLGVSKLQPYRGSRVPQPRPIRSASERSVLTQSTNGSYDAQCSGDDQVDKVKAKARNDPRYDSRPDKDGLYHCPYVREGACTHKPTKQKCIYAKYLDSHLKPYKCKYGTTDENCRNARFSSNACLFRHEREMHGLHNHGMNPYLCRFPGCERARKDMGFPRRWNQRDHMKRVHGWEEPDTGSDDGNDRPYAPEPSKRRKVSSTSQAVPMKRTSSSHARAQAALYQGQRHGVSAPRYWAQIQKEVQAQNIMLPVPMDEVQFSHYAQPMASEHYGSDLFMQSAY